MEQGRNRGIEAVQKKLFDQNRRCNVFRRLNETVCDYDLSLIACTDTHTKTLKGVLSEHPSARKIICLVGPEGGFTRTEVEMAEKSGCIPVSIGHSILRIETAVVAISSMLLYVYSD